MLHREKVAFKVRFSFAVVQVISFCVFSYHCPGELFCKMWCEGDGDGYEENFTCGILKNK